MIKIISDMDSGTRNTPKSKAQINAVRSAIRKVKNDELVFHPNHFEISGFIRRGNTIVYFNSGDFRMNWGGLARYASSFKDYQGERNNICKLSQLDGLVDNLLTHAEYIEQ